MGWGLPGTIFFAAIMIGGLSIAMSKPENRLPNLAQFAVIFIVLAIAVAIWLMMLGPTIGGPWSTINKSLTGV